LLPLGLAALMVAALAAGVMARAYEGYKETARLNGLIAQAERERQQARGKPTGSAAAHLQTAQRLLTDAQKLDPKHSRVSPVLQRVKSDWKAVQKVARLGAPQIVGRLPVAAGPGSQLVVVGSHRVVLDVRTGQARLYTGSDRAGKPLRPKGGARFVGISPRTTGVMFLDSTGRIHRYRFTTRKWRKIELGGDHPWSQVVGFDTQDDKVYIAFRNRSGILGYDLDNPKLGVTSTHAQGGRKVQPSQLVTGGGVWLADRTDDSIWRVVGGKVTKRVRVDAEPSVEGVFALTPPSNGILYMLDRGRDRVLQVSTDGVLRAQLRLPEGHAAAGKLQAVYPDASGSRLVLLAGNSLLSAQLPAKEAAQPKVQGAAGR
jgi:hypothetical protein